MPAESQPSYYLSEEACRLREAALIERIARDGKRPGESVPMRILVAADFLRGEMRVAT